MRIGFVTENYHTEVLDFLFELFPRSEDYELVLYNDGDNYKNFEIYEKKYENLEKKYLYNLIPDLNKNYCDKIFIITYENIIALKLLAEYRDKIIVICHTEGNIKECVNFKMSHLTLNQMLLLKVYKMNCLWMLPFNKNNMDLNQFVENHNNKKVKNGNKIKILSIGAFDEDNKDIDKIKKLLDHDEIELHIFLMKMSDIVKKLNETYKGVTVYEKIASNSILNYIKENNIQYVLYCPKEDSDFMQGKWSGCISFGISNNMPIILPKKINDLNKFIGCITYDKNDDIYEKLLEYHNENIKSNLELLYKLKEITFARNNLIKELFIYPLENQIVYTNHGVLYLPREINAENLSTKDYLSPNIINKLYKNNNEIDNNNFLVININSQYGVENLMMTNMNKNIEIISVESDLNLCKIQKKTNLLNFDKNVRIFNNKIGKENLVKKDLDVITIDNLLFFENLSNKQLIIHVNEITNDNNKNKKMKNEINNILLGCMGTIKKYQPTFVFNKNVDPKQCKILIEKGYHINTFDNRVIYTLK